MTPFRFFIALLACSIPWLQPAAVAQEDKFRVDPTFLFRFVPQLPAGRVAVTSDTASYKPIFGDGDSYAAIPKGISRFGELTVASNGKSSLVVYEREEHVVVVLEGAGSVVYGGKSYPIRANDFFYVPPGIQFGLTAKPSQPVRAMLMGFRIPTDMSIRMPETLKIANIDDVATQEVAGHPLSARYRLLLGDLASTRDRIATGHVVVSLYVMEIAPGGTNLPHHHETQEEIYLLTQGSGEIVAGGGQDGIEGRRPAKPGDAYFYRSNTTVGFYNGGTPARILAVRSNAPLKLGRLDR